MRQLIARCTFLRAARSQIGRMHLRSRAKSVARPTRDRWWRLSTNRKPRRHQLDQLPAILGPLGDTGLPVSPFRRHALRSLRGGHVREISLSLSCSNASREKSPLQPSMESRERSIEMQRPIRPARSRIRVRRFRFVGQVESHSRIRESASRCDPCYARCPSRACARRRHSRARPRTRQLFPFSDKKAQKM